MDRDPKRVPTFQRDRKALKRAPMRPCFVLVTGLFVLAGSGRWQAASSINNTSADRLTVQEAMAALDTQAIQLAQQDKFSGALLLAHGGKVLLEKAYGWADRDRHLRNTINTKFRIGSMNKMFTATAILQLVSEGKVQLGAPVGKYLPDYPNPTVAQRVTVRQLLTHTGGTGDIFTPEYEKHRLDLRNLADYVYFYGGRGVAFEPGSQWGYSNYGFILLGRMVEKVSGVSYYQYVREHIFKPLGMHDTDSLPESENVSQRSVGYTARQGAWVNNADTLPWRGTSAGGGYSTGGDLYRFAHGLCRGKLMSRGLFDEMTSKQVTDASMPPNSGYGFGLHVAEGPPGKHFGHGGGAPGMNGELEIYSRTDTIVVVLANLDPPAATRLAHFFAERMPLD